MKQGTMRTKKMSKIYIIISIVILCVLSACTSSYNAKKTVEEISIHFNEVSAALKGKTTKEKSATKKRGLSKDIPYYFQLLSQKLKTEKETLLIRKRNAEYYGYLLENVGNKKHSAGDSFKKWVALTANTEKEIVASRAEIDQDFITMNSSYKTIIQGFQEAKKRHDDISNIVDGKLGVSLALKEGLYWVQLVQEVSNELDLLSKQKKKNIEKITEDIKTFGTQALLLGDIIEKLKKKSQKP